MAEREPRQARRGSRNKETATMTTERLVRVFAGAFILLSLALGAEASPLFVSKHFLWFTAFVGANLFQSGFTQICPLESILRRLGVKSACAA
jgi:hypothetical protein